MIPKNPTPEQNKAMSALPLDQQKQLQSIITPVNEGNGATIPKTILIDLKNLSNPNDADNLISHIRDTHNLMRSITRKQPKHNSRPKTKFLNLCKQFFRDIFELTMVTIYPKYVTLEIRKLKSKPWHMLDKDELGILSNHMLKIIEKIKIDSIDPDKERTNYASTVMKDLHQYLLSEADKMNTDLSNKDLSPSALNQAIVESIDLPNGIYVDPVPNSDANKLKHPIVNYKVNLKKVFDKSGEEK